MNLRQRFLKLVYPVFMWWSGRKKKAANISNKENIQPREPFYDLSFELNGGQRFNFDQLKGKKVLLVNTASDCGYTHQYDDLQKLYESYKDRLTVIAFPANDFKEQEKGSDTEIAEFCKINYGVNFPLMKKSVVKKEERQNEVFKWLTHHEKNGWNDKEPSWNFSKYLVDEKGTLLNYFGPYVSPLDPEIINVIGKK